MDPTTIPRPDRRRSDVAEDTTLKRDLWQADKNVDEAASVDSQRDQLR